MKIEIAYRVRAFIVIVVSLMFAGCSSVAKQLNDAFADEFSGLNKSTADEIVSSANDTRIKAPEISATNIIYKEQKQDSIEAVEPTLALKGVAKSLKNSNAHNVSLFMDKPNYHEGKLVIDINGTSEIWPIVAFKNRGEYNGNFFEFVYLLSNNRGEMRSLVIVGNEFKEDESRFIAYEGTLIVPGDGPNWKRWSNAYKIDFGYKLPKRTIYSESLLEAKNKAKEVDKQLKSMKKQRAGIEAKSAAIASLVEKMKTLENKITIQSEIDQKNAEKLLVEEALQTAKIEIEKNLIDLIKVRERISYEYAAFVQTNQYTWLPPKEQNKHYKKWQGTASVDTSIDVFMEDLVSFIGDFQQINFNHEGMIYTINENNNEGKNPIKK